MQNFMVHWKNELKSSKYKVTLKLLTNLAQKQRFEMKNISKEFFHHLIKHVKNKKRNQP